MIDELYDRPIYDEGGNVYGTSAPNNFELMDKINELAVELVKKEEGKKE